MIVCCSVNVRLFLPIFALCYGVVCHIMIVCVRVNCVTCSCIIIALNCAHTRTRGVWMADLI